jgi:hypothetical protein
VATQHSLPSGRYSLLGPDFHRLDRTSFALAHLLVHLIGVREQVRRNGKSKYGIVPTASASYVMLPGYRVSAGYPEVSGQIGTGS